MTKHFKALCVFILVITIFTLAGPRTVQAAPAGGSINTQSYIEVPAAMNLQSAIKAVADNGVIQISAGTYTAPDNGYDVSNLGKRFTIQAAPGATVVITGGSDKGLLRFINNNLGNGRSIIFKGLTFRGGVSRVDGSGGAISLGYAKATFIDCLFDGNTGLQPTAGGGALWINMQSTVFIFNSTFQNNTGRIKGGAIALEDNSTAFIDRSRFLNNRNNLPGQYEWAAGGGIHVGNSHLRVTNSYFENNQAGYVGGAIYLIGTWTDPYTTPQSDAVVINSTFVNNRSARDPGMGVSTPPTEAGAIHAEDQSQLSIYNSRFIENKADTGGAVNSYRAKVSIEDSVFLGNQAVGSGPGNGFGAAVNVMSNDGCDATTNCGTINRPMASLSIKNTYIQGIYNQVTKVAQSAGGVAVSGDFNHAFGINGVPKMGSIEENRMKATMDHVVFNNLYVQGDSTGGTGHGGAISLTMAELDMSDCLLMNSSALGTNPGGGGAISMMLAAVANVSHTTFSDNHAEQFGGAIFSVGSTLNLSDSSLLRNTLNNALQAGQKFGTAIYSAPMAEYNLSVYGLVQNSVFSNNQGLNIYDQDSTNSALINDMHYVNNQFYSPNYGVYLNNTYWVVMDPGRLNEYVVTRGSFPQTDKGSGNTALTSAPYLGTLMVVPSQILPEGSIADKGSMPVYMAYAWEGYRVTLDSQYLTQTTGVQVQQAAGSHKLTTGNYNYTVDVSKADLPALTLTNEGRAVTWNMAAGDYVDFAIDRGLTYQPGPTGSILLPDYLTPVYFYLLTRQGGVVEAAPDMPPVTVLPYHLSVPVILNGH